MRPNAKTFQLAALCLLLGTCLLLGGCRQTEDKLTASGFFFDTAVTITAHDTTRDVVDGALSLCGEYERLLSKTVEGSDVWRLNHAMGQKVALDPRTMAVLQKAQEYSRLSGGAFDVTVAPIMELWDFTMGSKTVPDAARVQELLPLVDYEKLVLTDTAAQLPQGMEIDLGGIAKGYIADQVADYLRGKGVKSGLLNFGGNVEAIGAKPDGAPWQIGVRDPSKGPGDSLIVIQVEGKSVVTSGIYERGFEKDGTYYHHILDPATGWPASGGLASVTIVADRSIDGDALSTACFVLGVEKAIRLVDGLPGAEAMFISKENEISYTQGFFDTAPVALAR